MKLTLNFILILLAVPLASFSQDKADPASSLNLHEYLETGMEVAGIRVPYYEDDGELRAQLYGGYARLLEDETADVSNLRIDVYEKGKVIMTIFAPQCFTRIDESGKRNMLEVYSDGDVLIDMEEMSIVGKGFRFTSNENKFEILSDSKVIIKAAARDMDGVEL